LIEYYLHRDGIMGSINIDVFTPNKTKWKLFFFKLFLGKIQNLRFLSSEIAVI
jgi:hypothetical protein